MRFANYDNDCDRVSAIFVQNSNGYVEWGWTLGWLPGGEHGGICGSDSTYWTSPKSFVAWRPINGSEHCRKEFGNAEGQYFSISILDANQDQTWAYYKEGTQVDTVAVNFNKGTVATNGERHSSSDSAYAHFHTLSYQQPAFTSWGEWCCLEQRHDTDPQPGWNGNYNCIENSDRNTEVQASARTCS